MEKDVATLHDSTKCTVELSSRRDVYAGADIELKAKVSCSHACDRRGTEVRIFDQTGQPIGHMELIDFEGGTNEANELVVRAPAIPGEYEWLAVVPRQELDGIVHEEKKFPFTFEVKPHVTRIEVWDVPSAVTAGEEFRIKVGIKCSAGCSQTDREFEVCDDEGVKVASGKVGAEPWPGTAALYFTELALDAPDVESNLRWEVRCAASENGLPHEAGSRRFGFPVVSRPECRVTVEAVDREKQTPIRGMHVLLHPFRALTNEKGVAYLDVPKGEYEILVSGLRYFPYRAPLEVSGDLSIKAEVEWEKRPEKLI